MPVETLQRPLMLNLAVFSLPAVIRYDQELLRTYLIDAVNKVKGTDLSLGDVPSESNATHWLLKLYGEQFGQEPQDKDLAEINRRFTKRVKKYFIDEDSSFEIRPGVQSIFGKMEKDKLWKYCIISDYWPAPTHLMLQTCGVFSKNKFTITADDALTQQDQLSLARKRAKKKTNRLKLFFLNAEGDLERSQLATVIRPQGGETSHNYFTYPKFSELFKSLSD